MNRLFSSTSWPKIAGVAVCITTTGAITYNNHNKNNNNHNTNNSNSNNSNNNNNNNNNNVLFNDILSTTTMIRTLLNDNINNPFVNNNFNFIPSSSSSSSSNSNIANMEASSSSTYYNNNKNAATLLKDRAFTKVLPDLKEKSIKEEGHPCTEQGRFVKGCPELMIFAGSSHPKLALEIAQILGVHLGDALVSKFTDGETRIQINESVRGKDIYIVQTACTPVNDRIIELLLMISTMHRANAKKVTVVIPYFAYKHHKRGYPISDDKKSRFLWSAAADFAKMLQVVGADRVIAVDLQSSGAAPESVFFDNSIPVQTLITTDMGVEYYGNSSSISDKVTIVAPNPECARQAQIFQREFRNYRPDPQSVGFALFTKMPHSDPGFNKSGTRYSQELLGDVAGTDVIIVDDIIDSGGTLCRTSQQLKLSGAKNVYVYASHGLFKHDALERIEQSEHIEGVIVTNTIPLPDTYKGTKVKQLSCATMLSKLIVSEHFKAHLYNEKALVNDE